MGSRLNGSRLGLAWSGQCAPPRRAKPSWQRSPPILAAAGPLPHARLDTGGLTTAPRKLAARMLKCECQACGYTVRTARKWLETAGAPLCPIPGHGAMRHEPLDGEEEEVG